MERMSSEFDVYPLPKFWRRSMHQWSPTFAVRLPGTIGFFPSRQMWQMPKIKLPSRIPQIVLPARLFRITVLKSLTYGCKTWSLTKAEENMLSGDGKSDGTKDAGVSLRDHIDSRTLSQISGVEDIVVVTWESKICWVGQVAPLADCRWTSLITEWYP